MPWERRGSELRRVEVATPWYEGLNDEYALEVPASASGRTQPSRRRLRDAGAGARRARAITSCQSRDSASSTVLLVHRNCATQSGSSPAARSAHPPRPHPPLSHSRSGRARARALGKTAGAQPRRGEHLRVGATPAPPIFLGPTAEVMFEAVPYSMPPEATLITGTLFLFEDRLRIVAARFEASHRRRKKGEPSTSRAELAAHGIKPRCAHWPSSGSVSSIAAGSTASHTTNRATSWPCRSAAPRYSSMLRGALPDSASGPPQGVR